MQEVQTNVQNSRRKAIVLGSVFTLTYLASYFTRKLLGLVRYSMITEGVFRDLALDRFQSFYLIFYAAGQLINGVIGDYMPPRRMMTIGYTLAGGSLTVFALTQSEIVGLICFSVFGFGLSMVRGPIMKVISENTPTKSARLICTCFNTATLFGLFIASFVTSVMPWKQAYLFSGILTLGLAVFLLIFMTVQQKTGAIRPFVKSQQTAKLTPKEVFSIFRLKGFLFFMMMGGLSEIANTTVLYWLPSYLQDYFGKTQEFSGLVTSVISILTATCAFAALFLYRITNGKMKKLIVVMFSVSIVAFLLVIPIRNLWLNLTFLIIALLAVGCVSGLMWSIYIPGLGKTGKVSGANGILDCCGYLFASGANILFSALSVKTGWKGLMVAWTGLGVIGLLFAVFAKKDNIESTEE